MSIGFLDYRKLARALAVDLRLWLIAADRQQRIAEHGPPDGAGSNPIAVLRAACEQIKRSTGDHRPRSIIMHQAVYERYREWYIENIARAERLLGIGCAAMGAFPTGWPWSKRAGRMSREEKHLRESLPRWRSALANIPPSKSIKASNGGLLLLASADEIGDRLAVLLAGDRGRGTTAVINECQSLSREVSGASLAEAANEKGYGLASLDRHPLPFVIRAVQVRNDGLYGWFERQSGPSRRPTGKRAQRARNKPWNQ